MNFNERTFSRWFIIVSSLAIIVLVLWNTAIFFEQIKQNERSKMQIWVSAFSELIKADANDALGPLIIPVINTNNTTPMIIYTVKEDIYDTKNIPKEKIETREETEELVKKFTSQNEPIKVTDKDEVLSIVYYGDSSILNTLKYFPLVVILIIFLFVAIVYYFYATSKSSEQNKLWAGMAKETAHQIGTPLSSLVGWLQILKDQDTDPVYLEEIQKDIDRLRMITERFSKIGSVPTLEKTDIVEATRDSYEYLKTRSSKLIEFSLDLPEEKTDVMLNKQLYSWTIENLVSNAIDAMRGRGKLKIELVRSQKWIRIYISDTGKGISSKNFQKIFTPGETSKKRGWGLGLSLAKRIIEQYHNGKIKVLKSELGKGTTFEIKLRKLET
ncbi:MAG TPA: HAMP domain-containing sensor histidine kinase [Flavobacteriaceae bacterium]|nr:HAMP domain-containing sensor histidine kinase [Flavobacteriaceae bacterium]